MSIFDNMDQDIATFNSAADEFADKLRDADHIQDEREAEALDLLEADNE